MSHGLTQTTRTGFAKKLRSQFTGTVDGDTNIESQKLV